MHHAVSGPVTLLSGHDLVADTLRRLGVTCAFGVSGSPIHETLAACSRAGVRPVGTRHQQCAVMMAIAHNYASGRVSAVAVASAGPGVTNCLTGIHVACENAWPLVVIGGRQPLGADNAGVFQSLDALPIVGSITKWCAAVERCQDIPEMLVHAASVTLSGRPGPVYLDVSEAALSGEAERPDVVAAPTPLRPTPSASAVGEAAELLTGAKRPVLIIGKGVRWSEPCDELRRLVECLRMPFITSPMGAGFLSEDHPLCYTGVAELVQSRADVVLVVGARLNWQFRFGAHLAKDATLIQIDVHEPELQQDIRPGVKIVADAKEALGSLLTQVDRGDSDGESEGLRESWAEVLRPSGPSRDPRLDASRRRDEDAISTEVLARAVARRLPEGAVTVFDANVTMLVAQQMIPCVEPATRLNAGSNGCMGVGVPFAVGAALARPDRRVVAVCGDSAFGFSAMEIETAVRNRVPIVVVVADNGGISAGDTERTLYPPGHDGVAAYGADVRYDQVAAGLGAHAEFVRTVAELEPALERALAADRPS